MLLFGLWFVFLGKVFAGLERGPVAQVVAVMFWGGDSGFLLRSAGCVMCGPLAAPCLQL